METYGNFSLRRVEFQIYVTICRRKIFGWKEWKFRWPVDSSKMHGKIENDTIFFFFSNFRDDFRPNFQPFHVVTKTFQQFRFSRVFRERGKILVDWKAERGK